MSEQQENALTSIGINLDHLQYNYRQIQAAVAPSKVIAVIKSNGYGHGLIPIAQKLESLNTALFAVAFLDEAIELRKAGIKTPIMIFNAASEDEFEKLEAYQIQTTIYDFSTLSAIERFCVANDCALSCHINIDTGMGRLGFQLEDSKELKEALLKLKKTRLETVFTHLSCADNPHDQYNQLQISRFDEIIAYLKNADLKNAQKLQFQTHIANSGGILHFHDVKKYDFVRAGIILYGVYPSLLSKQQILIKPVLSLTSLIVHIKTVEKDASISYSRTWKAPKKTNIATVAIGYGHGFSRFFSNEKGVVLINNKLYPIVGRICMDHLMVNLGDDFIPVGENVFLIGSEHDDRLRCERLAESIGTIGYEILTQLNLKIERVVIDTYSSD